MKKDGTSNPYMRWSAIVYIAYWVVFILWFGFEWREILCYMSDSWLTAWFVSFVFMNATIFVFFGMPLLATLVYAQALFKGRSAVGFAAWILSMIIFPCHTGMLYYYDKFVLRYGLVAFFMIFGASLILPVALSAFSAKSRYTIPITFLLYALYSTMWLLMVATINL